MKRKAYAGFLFFPLSILFSEFLTRIALGQTSVFDRTSLYLLFFSLGFGFLIWLVLSLLPRKAARVTGCVILALLAVLFSADFCCKIYYTTFFGLSFMLSMVTSIATGFAGEAVGVILKNSWYIVLSFVPFVLFLLLRKKLFPDKIRRKGRLQLIALLLSLVLHAVPLCLIHFGSGAFETDRSVYTSLYSADSAIPRFGVVTNLRLELQYALFGMPAEPEEEISWPEYREESRTEESTADEDDPARHGLSELPYNLLDSLDFQALAKASSNSSIAALHQYFGTQAPTRQNRYTGMFEGKNLILICAEGFSGLAVSEELTPTLYRLSQEGFVFTNYYQPSFTQSTSGGEFAEMTGLLPTWVDGTLAMYASIGNYMPYVSGNVFNRLGYSSKGFHNNDYDYYRRNETHPNFGYDWKGLGNGLTLEKHYNWPESDYEMMKATADSYMRAYAESGQLFNAYYMTVSGHANYDWGYGRLDGNDISLKNKDLVIDSQFAAGMSTETQAYVASQVELDRALEYLLQKLDEYGIAEDTVICLSADHYPYAMKLEHYNELQPEPTTSRETGIYRNTLILWSGCMEEPVTVTAPCSSIDIMPTLCNLFGIRYDSRLYSGRDMLDSSYRVGDASTREPVVLFVDLSYSWVSEAGSYDGIAGTFTPNPGYEAFDTDEYVSWMIKRVKNMADNARKVLELDYYAYLKNYLE